MSPAWKAFRKGQLWYDPSVNVVRKITRVFPRRGFYAHDGTIEWSWRRSNRSDNEVVSKWAVMT